MKKKHAEQIMTAIKKALADENSNYVSVEHLFTSLGTIKKTCCTETSG